MSEIPEIEALELTVVQADTLTGERWTGEMVRWSDAESAIRSALDRQAREIVEAIENYAALSPNGMDVREAIAVEIRARFAPKEADPR